MTGVKPTPGQAEIASVYAFLEHRRAAISAHTRFGKTFSAGHGLGIVTTLDPRPLKIGVIGPREKQAALIREEYVDALLANPLAKQNLRMTGRNVADRMKRELSQKQIDFVDGKRFSVFSAADDAERIMGFGADIVVAEECDLIPEEAWPKILRMLGDDPDGGTLIMQGNPWRKGGRFYKALRNPKYKVIQIGWERGVREGRITEAFVQEMRAEMPPALFRVFYDSQFPDASTGQLIPWEHIERAADTRPPRFIGSPGERFGLDVAEGGADFSVLSKLRFTGRGREQVGVSDWQQQWAEADTMATAARAAAFMPPGATVVVDVVGVGKGVADRLRQLGFAILEYRGGDAAEEKERFRNRVSEGYWTLRVALEEDRLRIPDEPMLKAQLGQPTWSADSGRIGVDKAPEGAKSPDRADSIMMAWHGGRRGRTIWSG